MGPKAWEPRPTPRAPEHPRRLLKRASLQKGREVCDAALRRLVRSSQATDSAEPFALVKAFALSSQANVVLGRDWDHANASYWLRATEAHKEASAVDEEMLLAAAGFV